MAILADGSYSNHNGRWGIGATEEDGAFFGCCGGRSELLRDLLHLPPLEPLSSPTTEVLAALLAIILAIRARDYRPTIVVDFAEPWVDLYREYYRDVVKTAQWTQAYLQALTYLRRTVWWALKAGFQLTIQDKATAGYEHHEWPPHFLANAARVAQTFRPFGEKYYDLLREVMTAPHLPGAAGDADPASLGLFRIEFPGHLILPEPPQNELRMVPALQ